MILLAIEGENETLQKLQSKLHPQLFWSLNDRNVLELFYILSLASFHDDREKVYKTIRGENVLQWQNVHAPWSICNCTFAYTLRKKKESLNMSSMVVNSSSLKDMSHEEFMEIHNLSDKEFRERYKLAFLKYIFLDEKIDVLSLTPEERIERIWQTEYFVKLLQVRLNKEKVIATDEFERGTEEEKETIRRKDREYDKVRKAKLKTEQPETTKITVNQEQKMIQRLMETFSMTQKEAEAHLIERRSKTIEEKTRKEPESMEDKMMRKLVALGMTQDEARLHLIERRKK